MDSETATAFVGPAAPVRATVDRPCVPAALGRPCGLQSGRDLLSLRRSVARRPCQFVVSAGPSHVHAADPRSAPAPSAERFGRREAALAAVLAASAALELARPAPASARAVPLDEEYTSTPSGLRYIKYAEGKGEAPAEGQMAEIKFAAYFVNYEGKFVDKVGGSQEPFAFRVGAGEVMPGLDEAVRGMRPGGIRRLLIPPALGYRSTEDGPRPRSFGGQRLVDFVLHNPRVDASILMDVELVRVRK